MTCWTCSVTCPRWVRLLEPTANGRNPRTLRSSESKHPQERVPLLHAQAMDALAPLGARADLLRSLADWLLARHY